MKTFCIGINFAVQYSYFSDISNILDICKIARMFYSGNIYLVAIMFDGHV